MITYITDQRAGEPDILAGIEHCTLEIRDLAGEGQTGHVLLEVPAPQAGWTHESLNAVQPQEAKGGADAYLNDHWIGSTEV